MYRKATNNQTMEKELDIVGRKITNIEIKELMGT